MLGPLALPWTGRAQQCHAVEGVLTTPEADQVAPHGPLGEEQEVLSPGPEGLRSAYAPPPRARLRMHRWVTVLPPAGLQLKQACNPGLGRRGALAPHVH